ncbi:MmgE/PrpD family protein [Billgrantia endophytica]|uniref:MmgE/PrpD family protein n=1 Tax=Billgrantia endophytica TaxID=2033802 RepID=A0A2N7U7R2_9GAMM|nr:MmgE/PrpD family protein [Halomonas endophytica]PMR76482.1 hypothetical protein C1H69_05410 [Halomonas endophytica]
MTDTNTDAVEAPGRFIAERFARLQWEDLPDTVRRTTRLFLLDTLGVIAGAARAPGMHELLATLEDFEPPGQATVLLSDTPRSPTVAALANGAAAHALDFDDQHDPARVHAFCVVLPAALAAADARGELDGKRFVTALACGVELFCRLGLTCHNSLGKGWHPTTALGSLAAALTAGMIFDLDGERMTHALGLAYTQMSGTTQFIADGALAKRMGPGFAARNGVLAAQLARAGITGPHRYLEGKAGLFNLHERGEVTPEILTEGIGSHWHILDLSMKPYPCCRCVHSTIQLGLALHREGLRPEQVAGARILLGEVNAGIVGADFDIGHANPVVHAQFNAAYGLATALADGRVDIASYTPSRIRDERSRLAGRFHTEISAEIPATAIAPARIELDLADGTSLVRETLTMKGAPDDPMSEEEVLDKFFACMKWGFDTPREVAQPLAERLLGIEALPDIRPLIAEFSRMGRA